MSTFFDFTYNLNTLESIESEYFSLMKSSSETKYEPNSHFFVDNTNLANALPANLATDAFGPVSGDETDKYRTTSIVRASTLTKVFAICAGEIAIIPQAGDPTKLNLILKPSDTYAPIKIKYFIYRGIRKSDLIDNDLMVEENNYDPFQPDLLKKLWIQFISLYLDPNGDNDPPSTFPASLIGFDPSQSGDMLISDLFTKRNSEGSYQMPHCRKGEHIGNFTGEIGLDIVLDYGDYVLTNQEELFKLNMDFARKREHIFDTTTIPNSTPTKIKRYKEHIHQFMDAAAFWGSHIECGCIITTDNPEGIDKNTYIYDKILNKYQTKNKIYVYIQGERARSYNYYDSTRKVYGFDPNGQLNDTNGWPIIIREQNFTSTPNTIRIGLDINIDTNIHPYKRNACIDVIAPNNSSSIYPKTERPEEVLGNVGYSFYYNATLLFNNSSITSYSVGTGSLPSGLILDSLTGIISGTPTNPETPTVQIIGHTSTLNYGRTLQFVINPTLDLLPIEFQVNGTKSCSTFIFISTNLKQEFPTNDYFNELWPVNLGSILNLPSNANNLTHWIIYDKSRMVNLDDTLNLGAVIQNKVVFDNGLNTEEMGPNLPTKKRRLYVASLKRNSIHDDEHNNYNTGTLTAGLSKHIRSKEQYALNLYNDTSFIIYRGKFLDTSGTGPAIAVSSLSLVNESSYFKKNSFFHLGITEEEFNKLIYDSITVPEIIPPQTTIPQILPEDADNVFFHLEEDLSFIHYNIQKFKVGLQYEDNTGVISSPLYPSSVNEVYVYTLDGLFFFSKEYSDYQEFFNEFSLNARVDFRPKAISTSIDKIIGGVPVPQPRISWSGEYGFDWLRREDTIMSNDLNPYTYDKNTGKYYYINEPDIEVNTYEVNSNTIFIGLRREWYKSLNSSFMFPLIDSNDILYSSSWMSLYPQKDKKDVTLPFPKQTSSGKSKCLIEVDIELKINIQSSPNSLKIVFEKNYFEIVSDPITELTELTDTIDKLTGAVNKNLEISNKSITTSGARTLNIKIKCLKEFSEYKKINVFSTINQLEQLSGLLLVYPNDKQFRKETEIVFVNVKTEVPNRPNPPMSPGVRQGMDPSTTHNEEIEDLIVPFFNQALIDVKNIHKVDLDVTPAASSPYNPAYVSTINHYIGYDSSGNFTVNDNQIFTQLNSHFLSYNPSNTIYSDCFIIFFINEGLQSGSYGRAEGIGKNAKKVVVYADGLHDTTSAHELLHAAGLYHTFSNKSVFTRIQIRTDNIMDYSDFASNPYPLNVVSIWLEQWNMIRKHNLIKSGT